MHYDEEFRSEMDFFSVNFVIVCHCVSKELEMHFVQNFVCVHIGWAWMKHGSCLDSYKP